MSTITRRLFLRKTAAGAAAGGAITGSVVALPVISEAADVSPEERLVNAIKELQEAAQAIDPSINGWDIVPIRRDGSFRHVRLAIFALCEEREAGGRARA